jgi:protocatechuate 3,4-dioxygenase beta subunit
VLLAYIRAQASGIDDEIPVCGGFIEFNAEGSLLAEIKKNIDYSAITVQYFSTDMILKDHTNLAASGYYFLPIYDNESFILKISGPHGMNFEPEQYVFTVDQDNSIKDICKNDINFKFRGYVVEGQVSTFGSNDGPEGIKLELFNSLNEKVQSTNTFDKGLFKFKPILPGKYIIKSTENQEMFDTNHKELTFTVNINSPNFLERALIVKGYKVSGRVVAENEPLEDIHALIYSYNSTLVKNYKCEANTHQLKDFVYDGMTPFCIITTGKDGTFSYVNIPFGKFLIRTIYKNNYVSYELTPDHLPIEVKHHDYIIEEPFVAKTFSTYGKVINGRKNGIPNVVIKIDGQEKAITDQNGIYKLEKLTPGNYDLEAQADEMFFDPLTNIRITAHLKALPDLLVTHYKLCGVIAIEATDYFSIAKRTVVLQDSNDKSSKKERRTVTDAKGKYCFEVKPGVYHIYPVLTQEEKDLDLHLQPEQYDLEVIDRPLLDVNFYQSKVIVSGKIICKDEKCDNDIQVKLVASRTDRMVTYFLI